MFILRVFVIVSAVFNVAVVIAQEKTGRAVRLPNIILVVADDLGVRDLGSYGNAYMRTPWLDSLSRMGMRFTQAYSSSPVCSPARAGLLTGVHPAKLQVTNYLEGVRGDSASAWDPAPFRQWLEREPVTMAEFLKEKGYSTALIGKWHLGSGDSSQPNDHGFGYERVARNGIFYYNFSLTEETRTVDTSRPGQNLTRRLQEEAERYIRAHRDGPFFLQLNHFAPHLVLQPEPEKLPPYYFTYNRLSDGRYDPQYAATISTLDDCMGSLMRLLSELKLRENTLVIFTSDNGGVHVRELGVKPTTNEPFRAGKGHVYEGGIRVPLIVCWPGRVRPGSVSEEPVSHLDLWPTLAELSGYPGKQDREGFSLMPVLNGGSLPGERIMIWHYPHFSNQGGRPSSSIRVGKYKLVYHYETDRRELYDLQRDPGELTDLSVSDPDLTRRLFRSLQVWLEKNRASLPRRR